MNNWRYECKRGTYQFPKERVSHCRQVWHVHILRGNIKPFREEFGILALFFRCATHYSDPAFRQEPWHFLWFGTRVEGVRKTARGVGVGETFGCVFVVFQGNAWYWGRWGGDYRREGWRQK